MAIPPPVVTLIAYTLLPRLVKFSLYVQTLGRAFVPKQGSLGVRTRRPRAP